MSAPTRPPRDPQSKLREKNERWERSWQRESGRPESELATTVPKELKRAVERGWLVPGSSVLDIGSGRGQISAWLAERGFKVLGVDVSDAATQLARRHFAALGPNLEFRTADIFEVAPERDRFDALVDRGCFHGLPGPLAARYVENVALWSRPGAKMLLFHPVPGGEANDAELKRLELALVRHVQGVFAPWFELRGAARAAEPMERSAGPIPRRVLPGVVFRLIRRHERLAVRSSGQVVQIKIGDPLPEIRLTALGSRTERLLTPAAGRPLLLVFGSHSCGIFRSLVPWLQELFERFGKRVDFAAIYISEAYAEGTPRMPGNAAAGISIPQARNLEERGRAAQRWIDELGLRIPVLLDGMDDRARILFGAWPLRVYLVDSKGKVRFRTSLESDSSKPAQVLSALQALLEEEAT